MTPRISQLTELSNQEQAIDSGLHSTLFMSRAAKPSHEENFEPALHPPASGKKGSKILLPLKRRDAGRRITVLS